MIINSCAQIYKQTLLSTIKSLKKNYSAINNCSVSGSPINKANTDHLLYILIINRLYKENRLLNRPNYSVNVIPK